MSREIFLISTTAAVQTFENVAVHERISAPFDTTVIRESAF